MKIVKGTYLLVGLAIVLLSISIGVDYFKYLLLRSNHRYTIGYVTYYKGYVRTVDNCIYFNYTADGKKYTSKFCSNLLSSKLKGKRILVIFSSKIKFINEPLYNQIIPDSVQAPIEGWESYP